MMRIGFLGVGTMGKPIACNMLAAFPNEKFYFYARKENVKRELADLGAVYVENIPELGNLCNVIFVLLGNGEQCKKCIIEENGLVHSMNGGIIVVSSTIGYDDITHIENICNQQGIALLDAPISGGVEKAQRGNLTFIVSGKQTAYQKIECLLKAVANKIYFVNETVGTAQKIKLLNQILVGIHMSATAEVFSLGERMGLDLYEMYQILIHSAGASNILINRGPSLIARDFSARSTLSIMKKDLTLAYELSTQYMESPRLAELCRQMFCQAVDILNPQEDASAIIKLYEKAESKNE